MFLFQVSIYKEEKRNQNNETTTKCHDIVFHKQKISRFLLIFKLHELLQNRVPSYKKWVVQYICCPPPPHRHTKGFISTQIIGIFFLQLDNNSQVILITTNEVLEMLQWLHIWPFKNINQHKIVKLESMVLRSRIILCGWMTAYLSEVLAKWLVHNLLKSTKPVAL